MKESGQVVSEFDYRCATPNVIYSTEFTPEDADIVYESDKPFLLQSQRCVPDGIEQVKGLWVTKWKVLDEVPEYVEFWKMKTVIELNSLTKKIDDFIDSIEDKYQRIASQNKMKHASVMYRDDAIFAAMLRKGKISNEQIDNLFIEAVRIKG